MKLRKHIFPWAAMSLAMSVLWSCGTDEDVDPISLSEPSRTVAAETTSVSVTVRSQVQFRVSADAGWVACPEGAVNAGSHVVTLTLEPNTELVPRTAKVKFAAVAGGISATFAVEQEGYKYVSDEKNNLLDFRFLRSLNPGLGEDYVCGIGKSVIEGRVKTIGENVGALVATFTTDGYKVYVGDVEQLSGVSVNDFSKPVIYRVVSGDGSTNHYAVRLTRFTGLPILHITTASGQAVQRRSVWESATLRLEGGLNFADMASQTIEIKGRGNATWTEMQRKPSYNIRLGRREKVLDMPEHKRWSLLANYRDKTLLRNAVSYYVGYQCTGLEWTPKYRDVEMVFNGQFAGIYQLTEQIRVDKNRVDIEELLPTDTDPDVITGGYLIEVDQYAVQYDENYHFYTAYANRKWNPSKIQVIQKTPNKEDSNPTQAAYLQSYFLEAEKALYDAYSDRTPAREQKFAAAMDKYLDLPSIIDQWLVYEISGTDEPGNPNSYYMHKRRGDTRLYGGPVWDFDYHSYIPDRAVGWVNRDAFWFVWLFDSATFRGAVKQRWALLYPGLETKLLAFVDDRAAALDLSMQANWTLHEPYLVNEWFNDVNGDEKMNYKTAVARLRSYIPARLAWLNTNINNL